MRLLHKRRGIFTRLRHVDFVTRIRFCFFPLGVALQQIIGQRIPHGALRLWYRKTQTKLFYVLAIHRAELPHATKHVLRRIVGNDLGCAIVALMCATRLAHGLRNCRANLRINLGIHLIANLGLHLRPNMFAHFLFHKLGNFFSKFRRHFAIAALANLNVHAHICAHAHVRRVLIP